MGAVVVVAAGNSNTNASTATPANCAGVVTVTAVGRNGGKASYANTGTAVALAAPGGDSTGGIMSTLNSGTLAPGADSYASYMGTSMAAPVVSGVAALMLAANPKLTPDQVASLLKSSARAFPAACSNCGKGIVDANAAVVAALATTGATTTPAPAPTSPTVPAPTTPSAPVIGTTVAEIEPNNTVAAAQALTGTVRTVTGQVSMADTDYSKLTLPGNAKLTVTLSGVSTAALGLGIYTSTGQQLLMLSGSAGVTRTATITNGSGTTLPLVLRVLQNSGTAGAYKLTLAY